MSSQRFVALEGTDGSGKTSIRKALYQHLQQSGMQSLSLIQNSWLDPTGTEVITDVKYLGETRSEEAIGAALTADKSALSRLLIEKHRRERWVVADRYVLSDIVYHGALYSIPHAKTMEWFRQTQISVPDLTILVSTPPPSHKETT